jgi:hypothetical protein
MGRELLKNLRKVLHGKWYCEMCGDSRNIEIKF